ncbi:MauE/DoxX family redox-associated membrane protein [Roseateles koreensis]|uniref:Methylamine utilization protein MauE n=1 Tax=Roseateles koreensis TaxID=2987526 RepID=A0ABT5KX84_9BURK|nr:MauE/DoxX family redox-associated membrane protein [Roseateles koreensis]MDC8786382.1 methylamine utilization protein MauE [Roseateles koreensis]
MSTLLPLLDPVLWHAASSVLAAVLLIGAAEKLREPEIFRSAIDNYQLLPPAAVGGMALGLPWVEGLAGALLLPTGTRTIGAVLALLVMLAVTAAIVINLQRGRDRIDCGCGGDTHTPLSAGLVARNLVLILLSLAATASPSARPLTWLDLFATSVSTLFLLGLYSVVTTLLSHQSQLSDLRNAP